MLSGVTTSQALSVKGKCPIYLTDKLPISSLCELERCKCEELGTKIYCLGHSTNKAEESVSVTFAGKDRTRQMADKLAMAGYLVLLPNFFGSRPVGKEEGGQENNPTVLLFLLLKQLGTFQFD